MNFTDRSQSQFDASPKRRLALSGWFTPSLVAALCLALLFTSYEHREGHLHHLHTAFALTTLDQTALTGPGGPPPLLLTRSKTFIGSEPEFVSTTLLPGRGMDVLQITAAIPGHGEIEILNSPDMPTASRLLTDKGDDSNGRLSASFGGALMAPWAGFLGGAPTDNAGTLQSSWSGHRLSFPSDSSSTASSSNAVANHSIPGLLLDRVADGVKTGVTEDGQFADAVLHLGSFGGMWPSTLDIATHVQLSGRSIDLTMTARNTGDTATPIGLGWKPHFHIPSGAREEVTLMVPSTTRLKFDRRTGLPTGETSTVLGSSLDFQRSGGAKLGSGSIDETYVNLHRAVLSDGPIIELRDTASSYGVRIMPLSDSITSLHVQAPANRDWITLEPNTNVSDPLGKQWTSDTASGIHLLKPGETFSWKLRLEIFAVAGGSSPR